MRWGGSVRAGLAFGALLLGQAGQAAEVRELHTASTPTGATLRLVASAPLHVAVRRVAPLDERERLYVDLPSGTRLASGLRGGRAPAPPIAGMRVGLAEGGRLRLVLELDGAVAYRLGAPGRVVELTLTRAPTPEATVTAPTPRPVPAVPSSAALKIVIDPGHGGQDPGAHGYAVEKDVTLDISTRLARLLRERLGANPILTRARDATLSLAARTARANQERADLFVSIHANASPRSELHGIETYYLNNTADHATIRLAAMENGLAPMGPMPARADLRYILSDLVQVGKMEESVALASAVHRGLVGHLRERYGEINDLGVKRGPFYVLVGAFMPCVLVETSFLTHPTEGRRLADEAYRAAIAEGLYAGIARFVADGRRARTL